MSLHNVLDPYSNKDEQNDSEYLSLTRIPSSEVLTADNPAPQAKQVHVSEYNSPTKKVAARRVSVYRDKDTKDPIM